MKLCAFISSSVLWTLNTALYAKHQDWSQPISLSAGYIAQVGSQLCLCIQAMSGSSLPLGCKLKQLHPFVHKGKDNLPHALEIIPQFSYDTTSLWIYSIIDHLQFKVQQKCKHFVTMRLLWGCDRTEERPQTSCPHGPQQTPYLGRASSAALWPCSQADSHCYQPLKQYIPLCSHWLHLCNFHSVYKRHSLRASVRGWPRHPCEGWWDLVAWGFVGAIAHPAL